MKSVMKRNLILALSLILACAMPIFAAVDKTQSSITMTKNYAQIKLGYINTAKIETNYTKFQKLKAEQNVINADLQKFVATAKQEISNAKTEDQKKSLTDKYTKELNQKKSDSDAQFKKQVGEIQLSLKTAIKIIAEKKGLTAVFKDDLLYGGIDITDDVLAELNK